MTRQYVRVPEASLWLRKRTYFVFMIRELTSVFVAGYAVFLLVLVGSAADAGSFTRLYEALQSPWSVALHLVTLAAVLFHSITWINLMPKSIVLWRGDQRVPPQLIAMTGFGAWIGASVVVAALALI